MSINLSVKGVPDEWATALRARAERNHRSLQGELMAIIEHAVAEPLGAFGAAPTPANTPASPDGTLRGTKTIEQLAAELRLRFPKPIHSGPLAVDIIRADRDSR